MVRFLVFRGWAGTQSGGWPAAGGSTGGVRGNALGQATLPAL